MDFRLSIALLTRDRPEGLARALGSLRAQEEAPWEIVVSDDSEDPAARAANRAAADARGARWQEGPRRGIYANRNAAARACAGTHVRSMDDDHSLPPDHLARCAEAARRDPRALWTTGEQQRLGDGRAGNFADRANQLGPAGLGARPADDRLDDNWAVADGSTIFPRAAWDLPGGGFVEEWSYGQSYLEFGAWLYAHGWRSRAVRGIAVDHHADETSLARAGTPPEVQSRLFALICYHFHFRRSPLRGWIRLLAVLRGVSGPLQHLRAVPRLRRLARARWNFPA